MQMGLETAQIAGTVGQNRHKRMSELEGVTAA
jgi:hypothetical protein